MERRARFEVGNRNAGGHERDGQAAVGAGLAAGALAAQAPPVSGQGTWETTPKPRDIDGNAVALNDSSAAFFYDTTLDITWRRDFNAGGGSSFDDGSNTTDDRMTWTNANAWAAAVNVNGDIVRPFHLLVRRRVVGHLRERLAPFERTLVVCRQTLDADRYDEATLDQLQVVLASYLGLLRGAASGRLLARL